LNGELKNRIDEKLKDKTTLMYLLTSTGYQQLWDFVLRPALEDMWSEFPFEKLKWFPRLNKELFEWVEKWSGKK